jgi:hypothetical protein
MVEVSVHWIIYHGRAIKAPSTGPASGIIHRELHHPITGKKREAGCEGGIYQGTIITIIIIIVVGFYIIVTMG